MPQKTIKLNTMQAMVVEDLLRRDNQKLDDSLTITQGQAKRLYNAHSADLRHFSIRNGVATLAFMASGIGFAIMTKNQEFKDTIAQHLKFGPVIYYTAMGTLTTGAFALGAFTIKLWRDLSDLKRKLKNDA